MDETKEGRQSVSGQGLRRSALQIVREDIQIPESKMSSVSDFKPTER